MNAHIGELAALATSFLFSFSSTLLTLASRRVGSITINRLRLVLATLWLMLAHAVLRLPLPLHASGERWFWLGLSGIVGLVLGDLLLFQAFIWLGPRLSTLLMALAPALTSLMAWVFLKETLLPVQIIGMLLTLAGVVWVIQERSNHAQTNPVSKREHTLGLLCGLGAAVGQAGGMVLAKPGVADGFPAPSATLMRMLAATAVLWLYTLLRGQARQTVQAIAAQKQVLWLALAGSFFGPFLAVTLTVVAIQNTEVGIASTLTSLTPIFLLPVGYFFFKEKFGWPAIAGTLLAILGVALLFLA
jgi:drug/metabolite transporter (DMT)-like permease